MEDVEDDLGDPFLGREVLILFLPSVKLFLFLGTKFSTKILITVLAIHCLL